jgi:hypothetical protein
VVLVKLGGWGLFPRKFVHVKDIGAGTNGAVELYKHSRYRKSIVVKYPLHLVIIKELHDYQRR